MREFLHVLVGTDSRPATERDIRRVERQIKREPRDTSPLTVVTHHAVDYRLITFDADKEFLSLKVGSSERPASQEDLDDVSEAFGEFAASKGKVFATHHDVEIVVVPRV